MIYQYLSNSPISHSIRKIFLHCRAILFFVDDSRLSPNDTYAMPILWLLMLSLFLFQYMYDYLSRFLALFLFHPQFLLYWQSLRETRSHHINIQFEISYSNLHPYTRLITDHIRTNDFHQRETIDWNPIDIAMNL